MLHDVSASDRGTLLAEQVLGATAASISLSIPPGYRDLQVLVLARSTQAAAVVGLILRFNGDSGTNYDHTYVNVTNTTVTGVSNAATTDIGLTCPAATAAASSFASWLITVPEYAATTAHKAGSFVGGMAEATVGNNRQRSGSFRYRSTAAITAVAILLASDSLDVGTALRVYGMG